MRLTTRNGRTGKDGAFNARHNDRDFDLANATHIDKEKLKKNHTEILFDEGTGLSFEEAEKLFYKNTFKKSLEARNARYLSQRHPERVKTMDEYRTNPKTCPEETIYQIGTKDDNINPHTLWKIVVEQYRWEVEQFPQVKYLDVALHNDEATPHVHFRKVWVANGKDGFVVNQNQALKQMGIEAPEPEKKISRYNNPKITYTRMCREHMLQLCQEYGINIETEPKDASKTGLSLLEYKTQQEQKRIEEAKAELDAIKQEAEQAQKQSKAELDALKHEKGIIGQIKPKKDYKKGISGKYILTDEELEAILNQKAYSETVAELRETIQRKDDKLENLQEQFDKMQTDFAHKAGEAFRLEQELKKIRKRERELRQAQQAEHKERNEVER